MDAARPLSQGSEGAFCTEELLRENTTRMVLEAAPIGIVVVDTTGCIVLVNRNAQRLFGYDEMELIGQPLTLLIPEESREIHTRQCAEYTRNPHVRPMGSGLHLSARRKDGSVFPTEISLGFTETPQGLLSIAFVIDITKQREAEQLRDTMIHTLVHDLRNPLGAIHTSLEFLEIDAVTALNSDQKTVIEIALNNTQKMIALINSILEVNQLESGKIALRLTVFQVEALIAETLASLGPLAEKKMQHLDYQADSTLPPVQADAQIVRRVLENLIGNAVKFTPDNGAIHIAARLDDDPTKLRVAINDSGPGIPPELQPRLFGKFIAGKNKERGHGLGLAFCKLAIEAHGGNIGVESASGEGTTFWFTLPVVSTD